MDYSIDNNQALNARSSFNIMEAAALIAGIHPGLITSTATGEFVLRREWDCACEEKNYVRTTSFGSEDMVSPTSQQRISYADASARFVEWMDALYDAVEIGELPLLTRAEKQTPQEPAFPNMPRYAQIDALDPMRTKIKREEIIRWLTSKNITNGYFSPKVQVPVMEVPGYLDPNNSAYSWRLQLAIKAWEHAASKGQRRGVTTIIDKWLDEEAKANNTEYSSRLKEAIKLIANWNESGGAPNTP